MALDVATRLAQILTPLLYAVFVVVIYFQLRSARESVSELRQEFLAGGRPVVAVHDEYDVASKVMNLVVENVGQGPAKDVNFTFSRPIESSDGTEISTLPLFTVGLTSLSPAARITCFWDDYDDLMAHLREQGLEGTDFEVTVRYSDLTGAAYTNRWDIQPAIYEGLRAHHAHPRARHGLDGPATEPSDTGTGTGPAAAVEGPPRPAQDASADTTSSS